MKNRKYIIYKAQNRITGELYIGATTKTIHQRKLDHIERAQRGEQGQFQEAIGTYGPDAFSWTQVDTTTSIDELAEKEKEYILKYNSKEEGYNGDAGGGIQKTVYQYNIDNGNLMNTFDRLESAANAVNVNKQNISNACLGVNKTCMGSIWSYSSTSPIVLKDMRKKKVIKMNLDGNNIAEYNSISDASYSTGINKCSIAKVCRLERKQAGGFKWRFN